MPQEKAKEFKAWNGFGADSDLKSQGSLIGFETPSCCNLNRRNAGFNIFQSSSLVVSYFQTSLGDHPPYEVKNTWLIGPHMVGCSHISRLFDG